MAVYGGDAGRDKTVVGSMTDWDPTMPLEDVAAAVSADIVNRNDLAWARNTSNPIAVVRVSDASAAKAIRAWARAHNLEAVTSKLDTHERERRKAVIARAVRKARPLPIFTTDIRVYAWSSKAWL